MLVLGGKYQGAQITCQQEFIENFMALRYVGHKLGARWADRQIDRGGQIYNLPIPLQVVGA